MMALDWDRPWQEWLATLRSSKGVPTALSLGTAFITSHQPFPSLVSGIPGIQ